jgi:hypothetical protein
VTHKALDLLAAMGWALWLFYTRSGRAHEGTQRFAEAATALLQMTATIRRSFCA